MNGGVDREIELSERSYAHEENAAEAVAAEVSVPQEELPATPENDAGSPGEQPEQALPDEMTGLPSEPSAEELPAASADPSEQAFDPSEPTEEPATPAEATPTPLPDDIPAEEAPAGPDYLEMTIQSCVKPLDMRFSQINSCYRKAPVAYRTHTFINSVIEGVIAPEKYAYAADETDRGVRLSRYNIAEAIRAIKAFNEAGRSVAFVSARVSPRLVREMDFYGYVKAILEENKLEKHEQLCLEFPRSIVYEDPEQARMALLALKLLKVKSMMAGCGEKDAPITVLLHLPFDYLLLAPWLTQYIDERGKKSIVEAFISFLKTLGGDVIAEGVKSDNQISSFNRCDCYGYIPSSGYIGEVMHGRLRMPLEEALRQEEEEDV